MATLTSQDFVKTRTDYQNDRQNIFELQKFLQKISKADPDIPFLNTDGIYNDETREAVRKYQAKYNLPVTGEIDYETWESIYGLYEDLSELTAEASPLHIFPTEIDVIKQGDSGDIVVVIQFVLNSFAKRFSNLPNVRISGQYTLETAEAVRKYQSLAMLKPTGEVNRPTWNSMATLYRSFLINK